MGMLLKLFYFDYQQRKTLAYVVVKLSCDPATFLLLRLNQSAAHDSQRRLGYFAVRDVGHHANHAQHPAVFIEEATRAFLQPNNQTVATQHAIANLCSRV